MLADPSRVCGPGHRQYRIAVPHHHLDRVADDAQVHQRRARCVLVGVGNQLADHQLGEVHGTLRDRQAVLGLDAREEAGGEVAGAGDADLAGEIDRDTGQTLHQALDASGTPRLRIVVDLSRVTFMDSTGIHIFIDATAASPRPAAGSAWLHRPRPCCVSCRSWASSAVIDCRQTLRQALSTCPIPVPASAARPAQC